MTQGWGGRGGGRVGGARGHQERSMAGIVVHGTHALSGKGIGESG